MSLRQQRYLVAAAILGLHALLVAVLVVTTLRLHRSREADEEPLYVRYFQPPPRAPTPPPQSSVAPRPAPPRPDYSTPEGPEPPESITPEPLPPVDWEHDARSAADAIVADMARREHRWCDDSGKPGSWLPKCKKHPPAFGWSDEHRAGFTHGLPYIRLSKRCLVVAGFLGCALGTLPPANGHLFDGLKDPDRDRNSVPDVRDINESASDGAHRSPVFIDP
jgi:hypothetical protein